MERGIAVRSSGVHGFDPFWLWLIAQAAGLALLVTVFVAFAWGVWRYLGFAPPNERAAPAVDRPQVVAGMVVSQVAKGIGSPFPAPVQEIHVREGQKVSRGQLLFRMDTRQLERERQSAQWQAAEAARKVRVMRAQRAAELRRLRTQERGIQAALSRALAELREQEAAEESDPTALLAEFDGFLEWRVEELRESLEQARAGYRAAQRTWHSAIASELRRERDARAEAARLDGLIRQAKRYSPIAGVVTAVRAHEGAPVAARVPVVRVDDPSEYRVVTLVGPKVAAGVEPGAALPIRLSSGQATGTVEKLRAGWGRELFSTWVWLKPEETRHLRPDQTVQLVVPPRSTVVRSNTGAGDV